jgi:hypothetical protein
MKAKKIIYPTKAQNSKVLGSNKLISIRFEKSQRKGIENARIFA